MSDTVNPSISGRPAGVELARPPPSQPEPMLRNEPQPATTGVAVALAPRTAMCADGSRLEYFVSETQGPVLVLINALGLGLLTLRGLIEHFSKSYRVICWKPRGTYGPVRTLRNQVEDLDLILANEGVSRCRMVTWCSGAKVGIEFFRRRPIASSLVLMNGAYKSIPGLEQHETPFEQTMLKLCEMVVQRPALASTMMNSMRALLTGVVPGRKDAVSPLDGVAGGRELKAAIVEPFSSMESTTHYSHQVIDYLSHDIAPSLAGVDVPVLLLAGQNDQISAAGMSKAIAARLPKADYAELPSGTHYGVYEKPELVTALIDRFFQAQAASP
ncbi:alpha/beta fold hydrolase [Corallococcus llansteffanensis]|nr:alpha/beta hydrolase [Corallococcus llansteffanensis]